MIRQDVPAPDIDIRPEHWRIVADILRHRVPELEVWAFGSRAQRIAKPFSDLDLALLTTNALSLDLRGALAEDFSESPLPWKVDIVDWATTSDAFRDVIAKQKVVVQRPE